MHGCTVRVCVCEYTECVGVYDICVYLCECVGVPCVLFVYICRVCGGVYMFGNIYKWLIGMPCAVLNVCVCAGPCE